MAYRDDQLNLRVDAEIKKAFIAKAKENGTTATHLIVDFMKEYLGLAPSQSSDEIAEMKQRLAKLEQLVMGELAA